MIINMAKTKNLKYDIMTIGGATRDIMFYSGDGELINTGNMTKQRLLAFEYGAKILADKLHFSFGGGAANAAASFATLGLKTALVAAVGDDDAGKAIRANLKQRKIEDAHISVIKNLGTGFSMILTVNNGSREHIAFLYRGANDLLTAKQLPADLSIARWLYISSLPKAGWKGIMDRAVRSGAMIAWNPGRQQLDDLKSLKTYLPKVQVLIVNHDEALEFKKLKDIKSLLKDIHQLGPKIVVITDGGNGAYAYDGKAYHYMKAVKGPRLDTIGVGDAFGSAFVSALAYGKPIKRALTWGIRNSGSVVSKIGAQNGIMTKRQIDRV